MNLIKYIQTIILLLISLISIGQDALEIAGASLSIGKDAIFFVDGHVTSNGKITNSGNIVITGNWDNSGSYASSGRISFSGTDQIISHNGNAFNSISIFGGGQKTVASNFSIADSLVLEDGILFQEDSTAHIIAQDSASVSLGSEYSFIDGMFYHTGSGQKYYPIGNNETFLPIEMDVKSESSDAVVGYKLYNGFINNPRLGTNITEIEEEYYWKQDIFSGTLDSAFLSLPCEEKDVEQLHARVIVEASNLDSAFNSTGAYQNRENSISSENLDELGFYHITHSNPIKGSYFAIGIERLLDKRLLYIPNALSKYAPNPEDRVVKIYGNLFQAGSFYFKVFNKWGELVYMSTDIEYMETHGWDGTSKKGKRLAMGQYQYIMRAKYKTNDGTYHEESNAIYIID